MTAPVQRPLLVDDDFGPDPFEGIPAEVTQAVGDGFDHDTAGGCG